MCEAVHIPRAKDKTPAKLKRIFSKFALTVAGGAGTFAALEIILAQNVQQIRDPEVSYPYAWRCSSISSGKSIPVSC